MKDFKEALDYCGFRNLGFVGAPYTWCNNQLATSSWIQMFPSTRVHHISGLLSDHCPLWICTNDENAQFYRKGRPLRFEAVWMKDEGCKGVIKQSWESQLVDNPTNKFVKKIEACHKSLQKWGDNSFGNI